MTISRRETSNGILVTGTDTEVGKTYVSCLIARELREQEVDFRIFKPACSGAVQDDSGEWHWPDLDALAKAAGVDDPCSISPFRFQAAVAPPIAAEEEGRCLELEAIVQAYEAAQAAGEFVLVEGVGGLLCPLTRDELVADFASEVQLPLIIVARVGLGTINHTLLSIECATSRGLRVAGIILSDGDNARNDPSTSTNANEIARRASVPVLGIVPHLSDKIFDHVTNEPRVIDWIKASGI
jgi:dethiobiotin synthetase